MSRSRNAIAVVTGTRAEFGLLEPVMRAIHAHRQLRLRLIVTGTHLTRGTDHDIAEAGFHVDHRVPMQNISDVGRQADVAALGHGVVGLGAALHDLKPDVVMVLGDRIEAFAAASAASIGGFLLAHIHGGDRAEGVADEAMRHAITKLAHLHFPATRKSARRIIRMGEDPARVHVVGSPAVDGLDDVSHDTHNPDVIIMQHPIGASDAQEKKWMLQTLAATEGMHRVVMAPNSDPGSQGIMAAISHCRIAPIAHLPRKDFLSMLLACGMIVGNSSAGLIEAAALRVPCVNIGSRQHGREKPRNVVDADYGQDAVRRAMDKASRLNLQTMQHPYGDGRSGKRIAELLVGVNTQQMQVRKLNAY